MKVQAWFRVLDPWSENAVWRSPERLVSSMKASWSTQGRDTMDWSIVAFSSRSDKMILIHTKVAGCWDTLKINLHVFLHQGNHQCWSPSSPRQKCTHWWRGLQGPKPTEEKRLCLIFPTMVPIVRCLHSCSMPTQEVSNSPDVFLRTWNEGPLQLVPLNTLAINKDEGEKAYQLIYLFKGSILN